MFNNNLFFMIRVMIRQVIRLQSPILQKSMRFFLFLFFTSFVLGVTTAAPTTMFPSVPRGTRKIESYWALMDDQGILKVCKVCKICLRS